MSLQLGSVLCRWTGAAAARVAGAGTMVTVATFRGGGAAAVRGVSTVCSAASRQNTIRFAGRTTTSSMRCK